MYLKRVTGQCPIHKIPVPAGWDRGDRSPLFIFPKRSLDDDGAIAFTIDAIKQGGRALYLVPDEASAQKDRTDCFGSAMHCV